MATTAILHNRDSARLIATMSTSVVALLISAVQFGQSSTGELRVSVRDSSGLPVQSHLTLVSDANDMSQELDTAAGGFSVAERPQWSLLDWHPAAWIRVRPWKVGQRLLESRWNRD